MIGLMGMSSVQVALAQNGPGPTPNPSPVSQKHNHIPRVCRPIIAACHKAAATHKNAPKINVMDDCLNPILQGKTIPGIKVPPVTLQACQKEMSLQQDSDLKHRVH